MRQRKLKDLDFKLEAHEDMIIKDCKELKGNWKSFLGIDGELFLEIGSGKGQFICQLADSRPDDFFIAVEGQESVALRALENVKSRGLENVAFFLEYIENIEDYFKAGELDGIYLNFSDPWPKARHAKRRLTYGERLFQYGIIVGTKGFIEFKTDNDQLFKFTLDEIERKNLELELMTNDLHKSEFFEEKLVTEYEKKFSSLGKSINFLRIKGI